MGDRVDGRVYVPSSDQDAIRSAISAISAPLVSYPTPRRISQDLSRLMILDSAVRFRNADFQATEDEVLDDAFEKARQASIETAYEQLARSDGSLFNDEPVQEIPQNAQALTNMVEQMAMRLVVELPLLNDADADTLVFM